MKINVRMRAALWAAMVHLLCSGAVVAMAAAVVFGLWYPYPYYKIAGGQELFLLVITVDVICGPLLTLVLFNPAKSRSELWRDLALVFTIQLGALGYGLLTVLQARPLFLVLEIDRYKVIAAPFVDSQALKQLPKALQPNLWAGPQTIAIRAPLNPEEQNRVTLESVAGGRDYAERPEFYIPYEGEAALKSLKRAKPLSAFLTRYPSQQAAVSEIAAKNRGNAADWMYLPVMARQEWVAIIDRLGQIQGFLPGSGF